MVKVSTLFYVLENLESKNEELIDLEEINKLEQNYLVPLLGSLDKLEFKADPALVNKVLQATSTK